MALGRATVRLPPDGIGHGLDTPKPVSSLLGAVWGRFQGGENVSDPLSPYISTAGVRMVRVNGVAVKPAMVLDIYGAVTGERVEASGTNPLPYMRLDLTGPSPAQFADLQALVDSLSGQVSTLASQVESLAPYAVAGGRWNVTAVQAGEYTAAIGDEVLVLGSGQNVYLPPATPSNKGQGVRYATMVGGTGEYRINADGAQEIEHFGPFFNVSGQKLIEFTSIGTGWVLGGIVS